MGVRADRIAARERDSRAKMDSAKRDALEMAESRHAELGDLRRIAHAKMFEAKKALVDAEAAYRKILDERLVVQDEIARLKGGV